MATQPNVYDPNYNQFDVARKRLDSEKLTEVQRRGQAIKRELARQGRSNSGLQFKLMEEAESDIAGQAEKAKEGIMSAEQGEFQRRRETQEARDFSKSERIGSQDFANQQGLLGRGFAREERIGSQDFSRGERLSGQDFVGNQAEIARRFQTSERQGGQDFSAEQSKMARDQQSSQFGEQMGLSRQQFDLEKQAFAFNSALAQAEANKPTDLMGSMFGTDFSTDPSKNSLVRTGKGFISGDSPRTIGTLSKLSGGLGLCYFAGTKIIMSNMSYKDIKDIQVGDETFGGGKVTWIAEKQTEESAVEFNGEWSTESHEIYINDEISNFKKLDLDSIKRFPPDNTLKVYPMNTENGFYLTKNKTISIDFDEMKNDNDIKKEIRYFLKEILEIDLFN